MTDKEARSIRSKTLWIWVTLAFVLLISAWTALILVAEKHRPEAVPLRHASIQDNE